MIHLFHCDITMTTVASGMESETDSDCDITFSSKVRNSDTKQTYDSFRNSQHKKYTTSNSSRFEEDEEIRSNKNALIPSAVLKRGNFNSNNSNTTVSRQRVHRNKTLVFDDLRFAILQGNIADTKHLYESNGINADTILKSGWTGLMYACSVGYADIVEYLLQKNADPNFHQDMFTPLMAVCISKKEESSLLKCCSLLLQHKANVNVHERHHTTPLIFAAREGHLEIVKLLLEHGAYPNEADSRGYTALAWAAYFGHGQIVRILLDKGADSKKVNNMGQLPADIAYDHGYNEVSSILQKINTLNDDESIRTLTASLTDNNNKNISDSNLIRNSENSKKFVKLGELDLFLIGIDCQNLIHKFTEHYITFHDLLIMDDGDLEKIGIFQVGLRKKILEACKSVHKKEWQNSSIPNLKKNQYISCPDAVGMVANISKHLRHISTSVIYIRNQIQAQPIILELSKEGANIHNLMDEVEDSLKNLQTLKDEMRFLKMHLVKVQDKPEYSSGDMIIETIPKGRSKNKIYVAVGIATVSVALATIWWKYPGVLNSLQPSILIRIPFLK